MKSIDNIQNLGKFNSGKHGIVGRCEINDQTYVYKISKYLNFTVEHEDVIMQSLQKMTEYNPHFCKSLGIFEKKLDINFKKNEDPFKPTKNMFPTNILIMEDIEKSVKFANFIKNEDVPEEIIFSTIKQLLLGILMAQKECDFAHYDLHSNNVLMKKCSFDTVHVYKLDDDNIFAVPTYGYYPVIIDFGFSHVKEVNNHCIMSPLDYSNIGYTTNIFDPLADIKVLLVSLSYEISGRRPKSRYTKTFDNIIKNMFHELNIEWDCGWDNYDKNTAMDKVCNTLRKLTEGSEIFDYAENFCHDLIQNMIQYPLRPNEITNMKRGFNVFIKEFKKLENDFSNNFYKLYLLKGIVKAAKAVKKEYISGDRKEAVREFKNIIFDEIHRIKKFYNPECNFEKLLCGLISYADCLEGALYIESTKRREFKEKEYSKLEFSKTEHVISIIDYNIKLPYKFRKYSEIVIFDYENKNSKTFSINETDYIDMLNSCDAHILGKLIDKIHQNDEEFLSGLKIDKKPMRTPKIRNDINEEDLSSSSGEDCRSDSESETFDYLSDYEI